MRELENNIRDGIPDTGDFPEAVFLDQALKRLGLRRKAFCGAQISFHAVRVAARKRGPAPVFGKQSCNVRAAAFPISQQLQGLAANDDLLLRQCLF